VQLFLKVLVHHVDHSVAESPEEEQRADEDEREEQALSVFGGKKALIASAHDSPIVSDQWAAEVATLVCTSG
jgi:hypothetical protein